MERPGGAFRSLTGLVCDAGRRQESGADEVERVGLTGLVGQGEILRFHSERRLAATGF